MQTCNIMGVNIAVTDMDKTLRLVEDNCEAWRGKYICVANVHHHRDGPRRPDLSAGAERRGRRQVPGRKTRYSQGRSQRGRAVFPA